MRSGNIHSFESFGAVDGPGIRFVVFFQGCPLRCRYCHNPDSWDTGGTLYTSDEVVKKILPYRRFYRSGGGVTLSGGEPLLQSAFAAELLGKLHAAGLHTAIDTSGAVLLSRCRSAVDNADLLLLDIKSVDPEMSEDITGRRSCLEHEQALLAYCEAKHIPVWIRHVVVPGLTADAQQLRALGEYLRQFSCIEKIEPLPFHKLGEHKWPPSLYTLGETEAPTGAQMAQAKQLLSLHRGTQPKNRTV